MISRIPSDVRPLANGMSTDHPIPDLPFVEDGHIPFDDGRAVEGVGRHAGEGRWGRFDQCRDSEGWVAFATDWVRGDVGWLVRWHPEHGRSVVLYADDDLSGVHMAYQAGALLFRSGNYWWDGVAWYRPAQLWDRAREVYVSRQVPAATTITAADLLAGGADPQAAKALPIDEVVPDAPIQGRWLDHLAYWAEHRPGTRPLDSCVVSLTAPELTGDALVGLGQLAEIAGLAPSTLRSYVSRGQSDVPPPQALVGGRAVWARPVAEEWVERRHSEPEELSALLAGPDSDGDKLASTPAVAKAWDRLTGRFHARLWEHPGLRKRWALRWRTEVAVHEVARSLAWEAASDLTRFIPREDLVMTISQAWQEEFRIGIGLHEGIGLDKGTGEDYDPNDFIGINFRVARALDWFIQLDHHAGLKAITQIAGDAERDLHLPRSVIRNSLETALNLDGTIEGRTLRQVLTRLLPPDDLS